MDFDSIGRYEFLRFEGFDGPLLGHLEVKCSGKDGVRYGSEAMRLALESKEKKARPNTTT